MFALFAVMIRVGSELHRDFFALEPGRRLELTNVVEIRYLGAYKELIPASAAVMDLQDHILTVEEVMSDAQAAPLICELRVFNANTQRVRKIRLRPDGVVHQRQGDGYLEVRAVAAPATASMNTSCNRPPDVPVRTQSDRDSELEDDEFGSFTL